MNILYCKNIWWPFGSHLMHVMNRKIYADMHDCKLLYTHNEHPAYSLYGGRISELFQSMSDVTDSEIIEFADKHYFQASHKKQFLLNFTETSKFVESTLIDYGNDIDTTKWHEFKPDHFNTIEEYRASVMRKLAEPSNKIKDYLQTLPFIQEVGKLNGDYIAVHIRWTDKVNGSSTETDFYDVDVYFKHALDLREKYGTNNIVLNCDNTEALNKFLNYNVNSNLGFNIIYDKEESLPANSWKECLFQKWVSREITDADSLTKDLLNGFKIYKTIFEADSVICNYFSNMALAPIVARNNKKDVNISNKPPYSLFPSTYWPVDTFSEDVRNKRREGRKEKEELLKTKNLK